MAATVTIRPYQPGDESSIMAGWNVIFPAQDGLAHRDVAYWDWQSRQNTLGRPEIIVAVLDDEVVGQYASIPQRAVDDGKAVTIGLIVDAYVLPPYRRAGGRPGLIVHLARELHASYCGPRATRVPVGHSLLYGYPFPIWRLARRYLDSEMVRDMDVLFAEVASPGYRPVTVPTAIEVREIDDPREAADEIWARVAPAIRFGLVRDGAWYDWRYRRHPVRRYSFLLASRAGRPCGLAVERRGRYVIEDAAIVCDWLVPAADEEAEAALLGTMQSRARATGAPALLAVFPQNDPRFLRWQRQGFLVGPPSHFLVMNTFHHHVRHLRDVWYFTLGDSDLV